MNGGMIAGIMGAALGATMIAATGVAVAQTLPVMARSLESQMKQPKHHRTKIIHRKPRDATSSKNHTNKFSNNDSHVRSKAINGKTTNSRSRTSTLMKPSSQKHNQKHNINRNSMRVGEMIW